MRLSRSTMATERPTANFLGLCALLILAVVVGGASRADVAGQTVIRIASLVALAACALLAPRPKLGPTRWVVAILLLAVALPLIQLLPLPPAWWQQLPGRAMLVAASPGDVWRPLSISPSFTINAAISLVVPLAVVVLMLGTRAGERDRLLGLILALVAASMLVGALQFAGAGLNNPFVNDRRANVAGFFSNRNHFALFLAIGCLLAPVWALRDRRWKPWRGAVALGLIVLFLLVILSTGSRAGVLLGLLGLALGLTIARRGLRRQLRGLPRWLTLLLAVGAVGVVVLLVLLSIKANRAESFNRVMALDVGGDMRLAALPTVIAMVRTYLPFGTGFGSFDQAFRIHEPFALIKPTYFNRAHDDLLEVVLDGGIPALLLLAGALVWWVMASIRVWRPQSDTGVLGQVGSAILLLVIGASLVDYPARTPVMMAIIAVAALWLAWGAAPASAADPSD